MENEDLTMVRPTHVESHKTNSRSLGEQASLGYRG